MSIQKQYSTIDNISIAGSVISFDVTANDSFDIISILYNNSGRYSLGLEDVDITANFVSANVGNNNTGRVSICLNNSSECELDVDLTQYPFDEVLNIFTIVTSENPNDDCEFCDLDIYLIFDYLGEMHSLAEKILSQINFCECIDITDCDLEKFFLLEIMNHQDKVNTVAESVEFYNRFKTLCCD